MQITAGLTLGILAWDKHDRSTAAKRYHESLILASLHPPFSQIPVNDSVEFFERWVALDVQVIRENLRALIVHDGMNTTARNLSLRKGTLMHIKNTRIEGMGCVFTSDEMLLATNACKRCMDRTKKLKCCARCKVVLCELYLPSQFSNSSPICQLRLRYRMPKGRLVVSYSRLASFGCALPDISFYLRLHKLVCSHPRL